jgi:hypothetical protein
MKLLCSIRPVAAGRRGNLLIWAAFTSMAVLAATMISVSVATSSKRVADANARRAAASRIAEAGATEAADALRESLMNQVPPPEQGTLALQSGSATYTIEAVSPVELRVDDSGLTGTDQLFRIESWADVDGSSARSRRLVVGRVVPIFQYALVHEHDLIFFNPAPLVINGPVHTNGDLYILTRMPLEFDTNRVRVAGDLHLRAPYVGWYEGTQWWWEEQSVQPTFRRWVVDPFDPTEPEKHVPLPTKIALAKQGIPSASGLDASFAGWDANGDGLFDHVSDVPPLAVAALDYFSEPSGYAGGEGYTLQTQAHGEHEVLLPPLASMDRMVEGDDLVYDGASSQWIAAAPGEGTHSWGPLYREAGLRIVALDAGGYQATTDAGLDVTAAIAAAITVGTIYDARQAEGSGVKLANLVIDLEKLGQSGHFPANGLLHLSGETSGEGTELQGFQLSKGKELAGPLTVVSPDAVYIHGDYNTVDYQPAAVLADAVNLLSNSWAGTKKAGTLPVASDTTYNVALVLGDGEPTATKSNGGAVNLARYHEDWRNKKASIHGSIVCTGFSRKATGTFVLGGDYYYAPNRQWTFDERFMDIDQLPPFTPSYVDVFDAAIW